MRRSCRYAGANVVVIAATMLSASSLIGQKRVITVKATEYELEAPRHRGGRNRARAPSVGG